ncbi:hypothetical protein GJ496_001999 [Pomphorhynchus laevis]|nr:hypothetical protein GJ496_001999 [Pomphorhynchus laevis]
MPSELAGMSLSVLASPSDMSKASKIQKVIVHPIVLLSAADHYLRVSKGTKHRRVAGVLLGSVWQKGQVLDITNSFAVPFDEDKDVWFMDEDYLDTMWQMFRKVNARERIVGWYHTGPKLRPSDIAITERIQKYFVNAVLVVIDTSERLSDRIPIVRNTNREKYVGSPIEAYILTEEIHSDGAPATKTFDHVPAIIEAEEAEDVGVEHLLRDINTDSCGTLSQKVMNQVHAVRGFHQSLNLMVLYVDSVIKERLPRNQLVLQHIQNVLNSLSRLSYVEEGQQLSVLNDQMAVIYVAMLCRTIVALHDLINNKIQNRQSERNAAIAAAAQAAAASVSQQVADQTSGK